MSIMCDSKLAPPITVLLERSLTGPCTVYRVRCFHAELESGDGDRMACKAYPPPGPLQRWSVGPWPWPRSEVCRLSRTHHAQSPSPPLAAHKAPLGPVLSHPEEPFLQTCSVLGFVPPQQEAETARAGPL